MNWLFELVWMLLAFRGLSNRLKATQFAPIGAMQGVRVDLTGDPQPSRVVPLISESTSPTRGMSILGWGPEPSRLEGHYGSLRGLPV